MIRRLLIIAVITGLGHLTTLLSLKFITNYATDKTIAYVGEIDSLTLLIVSIVAFGLQLSATREIALLHNWKKEFYKTQSARVTLALILMILGTTGYFFSKNYLFFMAPLIALNGDYALYGRGKPIAGSFISLLRVTIPSLTLVFASIFFQHYIIQLFVASLIMTYLLTGVLVSKALKTTYFVKPNLKSLNKYISNFNIGIASFSLFFIGIGLINILSYFNDDKTIAVAYIALKFYMIYKGVRRIIVQAFFKDLIEKTVALKVDVFAMIAGIIFLDTLVFYPKVIIALLFDEKYVAYTMTFVILGLAGFVSSFTTSSGTKLLLKKKDKAYSINLIVAAAITIIGGIILSFLEQPKPFYISVAVLLGEITLSLSNIRSLSESHFLLKRIKYIIPLGLMTLLFFIMEYFFGQSLYSFITSLVMAGVIALLFVNIKFKEEL